MWSPRTTGHDFSVRADLTGDAAVRGREDHQFPVPGPAAHVRVQAGHTRAELEGGPGDPRAPDVQHDTPLRSSEPGSPARCGRVAGGLQHDVSTKRGRIAS